MPELDIVLDTFAAGGSLSVDLLTKSVELGVEPRRLRRRLERLAPAGVTYMPAAGGQLAQVVLASRGDAGGARPPRRDARARPPVAGGGTRAGGSCSVVRTGSSLFGSVRTAQARVPQLAYTPEEAEAREARAIALMHRLGVVDIPAEHLPALAAAVYSAEDYLGDATLLDKLIDKAIELGPDLSSNWTGWANHLRRSPIDHLTRMTFMTWRDKYQPPQAREAARARAPGDVKKHIDDVKPDAISTLEVHNYSAGRSWDQQCDDHPQLRSLEVVARKKLGGEVFEVWFPMARWTIDKPPSPPVLRWKAKDPYVVEWIDQNYRDALEEAAEVIGCELQPRITND